MRCVTVVAPTCPATVTVTVPPALRRLADWLLAGAAGLASWGLGTFRATPAAAPALPPRDRLRGSYVVCDVAPETAPEADPLPVPIGQVPWGYKLDGSPNFTARHPVTGELIFGIDDSGPSPAADAVQEWQAHQWQTAVAEALAGVEAAAVPAPAPRKRTRKIKAAAVVEAADTAAPVVSAARVVKAKKTAARKPAPRKPRK
jgi:hypothetical protein